MRDAAELLEMLPGLIARREFDTMGVLLAEDVVFKPDPRWPEQGPWVGVEANVAYFREFVETFGELRLGLDGIETIDGWAVGRCAWITEGLESGAATDAEFTMLFRAEGGLVAEIRAFFDREDALAFIRAR